MLYTKKALDEFYHPHNVGELEDADCCAQMGEPECGDTVKVWVKLDGKFLKQVTFKAFGCPAVIACCSMMTQMATGMHLIDAYRLNDDDIVRELGGMPYDKLHCSVFAAEVLHKALDGYFDNLSENKQKD